MTRSVRSLASGLVRALADMTRRPWLAVATIGSIAIALSLVAVFHLAARNVDGWSARWNNGVQMIVYLDDGTPDPRANALVAALVDLPAVRSAELVPSSVALARLRDALGDHDELIAGVEQSMVPASIEVSLAAGVKDVAAVHPMIERLRATAGVEEVEFLGDWVGRVSGLAHGLQYAAWILLLLVGSACVYLVALTVGLALRGRDREREVLELMGASPAFVRGPVLLQGVLHGALGGGVALGALFLLYRETAGAIAASLSRTVGVAAPVFLSHADMLLLVAVGGLLGLVGSWLASGRRALI